MYAC